MLRSLASDFKEAGHQVVTILDRELMDLEPPFHADLIIPIESLRESREKLRELLNKVDTALAIAPETEGRLKKIVRVLEKGSAISMNSTSESIGVASRKMKTYEILEENDLPLADWRMIGNREGDEIGEIEEIGKELGYPLVIRPVEGVGCDGVSVLEDESQIPQGMEEIRNEKAGSFLIQKYIRGTAASVGLISSRGETTSLSLNLQRIKLSPPNSKSKYIGGTVPFHHRIEKEALEVASRTIDSIEGLKGYVGVDLVLSEEGPTIMEINPRLTTSYIGLSEVAEFNPAEAMLDAVLKGKNPEDTQTSGYAFFSKLIHEDLTREAIQRFSAADEVVSPPFPIPYHDELRSLVLTKGRTLELALQKFDIFRQRFH